MADAKILAQVRSTQAHVRGLARAVAQLKQVAEKHNTAIAGLEQALRKMVELRDRDADLDDGVLDLPRKDRAALKALDNQ